MINLWSQFSGSLALLLLAIDITLRIFALLIIPNNRKPSSAAAWLLAIFFVPSLGLLAFFLIGNPKLPKARRKKQSRITKMLRDITNNATTIRDENNAPDWLMSISQLSVNLGALPLVGGNNAILIDGYEDAIKQMTKAVNKSEKYVNFEFYITSYDKTSAPLIDALINAHKRGVKVKVLIDHIGSLPYPDYKKTVKLFNAEGLNWRLMLPVQPFKGKFQRPDLRNHRKILICDGLVAFTGSQNIIDSSYNKKKNIKKGMYWKELVVKLEGLVVAELNALFAADWYAETNENILPKTVVEAVEVDDMGDVDCQVIPSGPGFDSENNLKMFNSLIYSAQKQIIISSPYFVPDESILMALTTAAERGVRVELFVSEIGDQLLVYHAQRSYYETLLRAGIKIYMYKSPAVLHAKHMTIDDSIAVVGSSNMDIRSFGLNFEVSVLFYAKEFVDKMRAIEDGYRINSKKLQLKQWVNRPYRQKFLDNVARLTSALQ